MENLDRTSADVVLPLLNTHQLGRAIEYFDEVTSTSDVAHKLALDGAPHGTVVLAERQTSGRGRHGRSWVSPPGLNLYMSVILRPEMRPALAPELTLVAAVAACEAVRAAGVPKAMIKWPNDLEVGGRKLAGMLNEMHATGDDLHFVIIGMGIDVNMDSGDFPAEIRDIATSVRIEAGNPVARARFCADLLARLENWYDRYLVDGFTPVRTRWAELSSTIGTRVRVQVDSRAIEGKAVGLDELGALIVRTDAGAEERVLAGDLKTLRSKP